MDTIKFVIEQYVEEEFGFGFPVINIYINGRNLIDLVSEIENRQPGLDNKDFTRSGYLGFEVTRFERFHSEMLGKKAFPKSVLLTCTCTFEQCNCLMAEIVFEAQVVTWSAIKNPWLGGPTPSPFLDPEEAQEAGWKPVDYADLGPFVFDREQYLVALDKVTQEWESNRDLFFPPASSTSHEASEYGLFGGVAFGK